MFLRQTQMSICIGCRFFPGIANAVTVSKSKISFTNSAMPMTTLNMLKACRSITTSSVPVQCWTRCHICRQSHSHASCHCKHNSNKVAISRKMQNIGNRMYATSSTSKEQPQRRVYKLMQIKAKDFEKVNPDTYFEGLEPSMVQADFEESKELEDANDMVKKLFSLEVANQRQISEKQTKVLNEKVQLDPENENRHATLVVKMTVLIRSFSRRLQSYEHRKDVGSKVRLVHLIDKRRKMLKILRRQNFAQFEKVKEELEIDWVPFGRYDYFPLTKRMKEKDDIIKQAGRQRRAALKEYMENVRIPQMKLEIAQIKRDLGQQLTEEEQEQLRQSEEIENEKK